MGLLNTDPDYKNGIRERNKLILTNMTSDIISVFSKRPTTLSIAEHQLTKHQIQRIHTRYPVYCR